MFLLVEKERIVQMKLKVIRRIRNNYFIKDRRYDGCNERIIYWCRPTGATVRRRTPTVNTGSAFGNISGMIQEARGDLICIRSIWSANARRGTSTTVTRNQAAFTDAMLGVGDLIHQRD